jgi:multiple sugar transport system permease protein
MTMATSTPTRSAAGPAAAPSVPSVPVRRRRDRSPRALLSRAGVNGFLIIVAVYTLMPVTWLLFAATKNNGDLFGSPGFQLGDFNLFSNIGAVFQYHDGLYARWLGNSLLYSVVGSLASTFVSLVAGYAFDTYDFPGKEKLFGVVLAGILIPATVVSLPIYLMASRAGLVDTYWAVLIPGMANPFGVYLARVFAEGYVPGEVLEAARMDGAGELRTFRSVSLPMLAPAFITIFLFSFTASWNNFFLPLVMLNNQDLYPVGLGLYQWNVNLAQVPELYHLVITGSLISVVPPAVAFLCLQRFWRSGLTAGAVK